MFFFLNNLGAKQEYFSSKYLCKIVTKIPCILSHKFTLEITVKRIYMGQ